jgi:hypothetical protein
MFYNNLLLHSILLSSYMKYDFQLVPAFISLGYDSHKE